MNALLLAQSALAPTLIIGFAAVLKNTVTTPVDLPRVLPPVIDLLQQVALRDPEALPDVVDYLRAILRNLDDEGPTPQAGQGGDR